MALSSIMDFFVRLTGQVYSAKATITVSSVIRALDELENGF